MQTTCLNGWGWWSQISRPSRSAWQGWRRAFELEHLRKAASTNADAAKHQVTGQVSWGSRRSSRHAGVVRSCAGGLRGRETVRSIRGRVDQQAKTYFAGFGDPHESQGSVQAGE